MNEQEKQCPICGEIAFAQFDGYRQFMESKVAKLKSENEALRKRLEEAEQKP